MSSTPYDPEIYNLFYPGNEADVRWYSKLALASGGPVLELGAGTGRTVLPIARAGIQIDALDAAPEMLESLRQAIVRESEDVRSRVNTIVGDMASFSLPRCYSLVQIPFRAFLHNLTRQSQLSCLSSCYAHLRQGCSIALNVFHPSLTYMSQNHGPQAGVMRWTDERELPDGSFVILYESTTYKPVKQQLVTLHRYERYAPTGILDSAYAQLIELAYLYPNDIRNLLETVGFTNITIQGGFNEETLTSDDQELVVLAVKP